MGFLTSTLKLIKDGAMPNFSVHCLECGSEKIVMLNATVQWDFQLQQWIYNENPKPLFLCTDCSVESEEVFWRDRRFPVETEFRNVKETSNA